MNTLIECRHICVDIASRTDSRMDNVVYLANKLQTTVESQWSSIDGDEEEAMEALHLRRTAQKVLSRASILSDLKSSSYEESVRSQSVVSRRGDTYDKSEATNIEVWIEQLIKSEDEYGSATLPVIERSDVSTEIDRSSSHKIAVHLDNEDEDEFNPEEDFDLDLMLALSKAGKKHYQNSNPEQAAENLDLALQYAQKLSPARYMRQDLTRERLILATIYLQKRDFDKADEHLSTLLRESIATQENKEMINDAHLKLARVYYMKKAYDEALQHCQKCLHARMKMYGKTSKQYYEAIQLLVLIYSGKGSHLEADVMLDKLPDDLREETELQLQTSAPVGGSLPTSPPLSPQPTAQHSRNHSHSRTKATRTFFAPRKTSTSVDKGQSSLSPPPGLGLETSSTSSNDMYIPRHSSVTKDINPTEILAKAGFTGDFDSAKALHWAVVDGQLKLVHYLLEGYTVPKSRKSKFSLHPLDHSSTASSKDGPDSTVTKRARVDGSGKSKAQTPLMASIEHGRVMIAKLLLDRGASISLKDDVGRSPLRSAAEHGNAEIVKLLLAKGAWIESPSSTTIVSGHAGSKSRSNNDTSNSAGNNTASDSASNLNQSTGQDTSNHSTSNNKNTKETPRDSRAYTPLHGAAANGHEEIVLALLEAGSAIDARDTHGATALKHACQRGQQSVARLLLHEGAAVSAADDAGFTPLMAAAFNGCEGVVRLLRGAKAPAGAAASAVGGGGGGGAGTAASGGATGGVRAAGEGKESDIDIINASNALGQTPLILASEQGREGTCKLLLSAGARLEDRDNAGWTALISAANKGHMGTVLLLLGAGANIDAQSSLGSTALDRAEYRSDRRLAGVLRENGAMNGTRRVEKQQMTAFTGYTL